MGSGPWMVLVRSGQDHWEVWDLECTEKEARDIAENSTDAVAVPQSDAAAATRMREALEFYADHMNYHIHTTADVSIAFDGAIISDQGKRARAALEAGDGES